VHLYGKLDRIFNDRLTVEKSRDRQKTRGAGKQDALKTESGFLFEIRFRFKSSRMTKARSKPVNSAGERKTYLIAGLPGNLRPASRVESFETGFSNRFSQKAFAIFELRAENPIKLPFAV